MITDQAPHMKKSLGLTSVVLFGLAYMGPLIVIGVFGVIAAASEGAAAGAMFLATAAILFTALSYGKMARHYPVSGSAYTYVRKTIGPRAGFMVGWSLLLDYVFIPLVIWLIGAEYLYAQFPQIDRTVWLVLFIVITTVVNIIGIKVADRANMVIISFQVIVLAVYFFLAIQHILNGSGPGAFLTLEPFLGVHRELGPVASGAAIAAYVFLGFDAVTTLSEETKKAERNIPLGVVLVALIGGVVFVSMSFLLGIIMPGGDIQNAASAGSDIAATIGGDIFGGFFLAALVSQQVNAGIAAQASSARLLYAMGRDGVFPKSFFGKLSARFLTPVNNILVCGVIGLGAIFMTLETSTSFINFGAFVGFTMVNVSVIVYFFRHRAKGLNPLTYLVLPLIGAAVDVYLILNLDQLAQIVGLCWAATGFVYLLVLTRAFTRPTPDLNVEPADPADVQDGASATV
ncbi:MAG TPA: APC family permease [Paenarthrobacter sp.]|nr:APC family permease [Paenarthrobacter sp.]